MRILADTGVKIDRMIGVYCGTRSYVFDDIQIMPVEDFVNALFSGEIY